jgi:hypothetical protein
MPGPKPCGLNGIRQLVGLLSTYGDSAVEIHQVIELLGFSENEKSMTEAQLLEAILEAQKASLEELQRIRHRLGTPRLTHRDHVVLGKLLPAIAGRYGGGSWTVRELLADPVFPALMPSVNGNAAQGLGNLLARSVGMDVDGLAVEKVKTEHGASIWRLVRSR